MRILMVTEDLPAQQVGGLGKHVVTLANHLICLGHEVDILGRSDRDYASSRDELGFKGRFIEGFPMSRNGWKETQLGVFMPPKRPALARRIADAILAHADGYRIVHYHGHLPMVGRYLPASIPFVQTRHDQGSECVMHIRFRQGSVCESTDPASCARCMHAAPGTIRTAVSAHAVIRYRREVAETFAQRPTIFVSDFLRRNFTRAVPRAAMSKSHVIHNFIDLKRVMQVVGQSADVKPGSILVAGRIDEAKGFGAFLEALRPHLIPGVVVDVVGDGPDRPRLESAYASEEIRFSGWQAYEEVIRRTRVAHVCVVPSVWEEPCGTTVLEALCLGRPCIALARGGTPELAAYVRYPGQLALAKDMSNLVQLTMAAVKREPVSREMPQVFGADVVSIAAKILSVYEEIAE